MSGYIEGKINTRQYSLIPTCYDEMISEDNPVRVLEAFVDSLDMKDLNFKNANRKTSSAGRPSYNPKDLLKLYLYGYFNGIRSSRKLARECERNIEIFWLINELKPDFRTISDFRKDNIKGVFKEFSILCDSLNLTGKEIVAIDVTSSPADQGQLSNMAIKSRQELNVESLTVLADKGYWNGEELKKCEKDKIIPIVASPEEQGNLGYKKSDFKYNKEQDYYVCPMGKILHKVGNKEVKYVNRQACKNCPNKEKCTSNKSGRAIRVSETEEYLEKARQMQKENMNLYKTRQMIVEHVFGTIKRDLGYTYLLLRGNQKVKGESFMHFLIYNIKRVCNIKSILEVIEAILALRKEDFQNNTTKN